MRIAHFVESFSPVSETFIYDYITSLEKKNIHNHMITLVRCNLDERPFECVSTLTLPSKYHPKRIWRKLKVLLHLQASESIYDDLYQTQLYNLLKHISPDIVHAQFGPAGVLIAPVAKVLNIPLVVTFHGYDFSVLMRQTYWQHQYLNMFGQAALLIGVSDYVCQKLIDQGADACRVLRIYNAIDTNKFHVLPEEDKNSLDITCIHVGRLVEKKDPLSLLKAFSLCVNEIENDYKLSLVIVGNGPLLPHVKCLIKSLGLDRHVQLIEALSHHEIPKLLQIADIYTQHSVTASNGDEEGMGISFAEASAMELPVVATQHNGIPEVILDGNTGFLVPEKDVRAMADRILELCRSSSLRKKFGRAGRLHIQKRFSVEEHLQKHLDAFRKIKDHSYEK